MTLTFFVLAVETYINTFYVQPFNIQNVAEAILLRSKWGAGKDGVLKPHHFASSSGEEP